MTAEVLTPTNTTNGFLGYIAAGPDGAMWFTEVGGKIGRIPTGATVPPAPTIALVANAEGEAPTIAPNTWVEIKGMNLAPAGDSRSWQTADFVNNQMPVQLDGVSATVTASLLIFGTSAPRKQIFSRLLTPFPDPLRSRSPTMEP